MWSSKSANVAGIVMELVSFLSTIALIADSVALEVSCPSTMQFSEQKVVVSPYLCSILNSFNHKIFLSLSFDSCVSILKLFDWTSSQLCIHWKYRLLSMRTMCGFWSIDRCWASGYSRGQWFAPFTTQSSTVPYLFRSCQGIYLYTHQLHVFLVVLFYIALKSAPPLWNICPSLRWWWISWIWCRLCAQLVCVQGWLWQVSMTLESIPSSDIVNECASYHEGMTRFTLQITVLWNNDCE
jgi:hypothetical protein